MIHIKDSIVITPNKYILIGGYLLRKFNVYRTEPTYEGYGKCGEYSCIIKVIENYIRKKGGYEGL